MGGWLFIMKLKRGTIREDGMVFFGYYKRNNLLKEYWVTKEKYEEYIIKERNRNRIRYKQNPNANLNSCRRWYEKNKELKLERCKKYRSENKDVYRKYMRSKRKNNYLYKCSSGIRSLIVGCMRNGGYRKKTKTADILGCSFEEFKTHIESQFQAGMSWENRHLWQIDHIMPVSMAKTYDEVVRLNHYKNLRPLWANENQSKGNKTPDILVLF
jgi:hypothetical protein